MKSAAHYFKLGIKALGPIIPGVIPFGLIMGTAAENAGLGVLESTGMNFIMFAGAAQLITIDLFNQNVSPLVIVLTGLVINLRMMLYSASFAGHFKEMTWFQKTFAAYTLTDQSYAVTINTIGDIKDSRSRYFYYMGSGLTMLLCWNVSVIVGMQFGNIAPTSISLDFAVPLSFLALTIPSLKDKTYIYVALTSSLLSILFYRLPFNLGIVLTGVIGVSLGYFLSKNKKERK